jgi:hypothetical protein
VEDAEKMADALENLLGFMSRSDEYAASCGLALTRAEELRREASRLDAKDAAISYARTAFAKFKSNQPLPYQKD